MLHRLNKRKLYKKKQCMCLKMGKSHASDNLLHSREIGGVMADKEDILYKI
jgi:hypothetical protein